MTFYDFQTTTHAKWILAGEHAVLRGHGALVFPLPSKTLTLTYEANPKGLSANCNLKFEELFWRVLKHGQQLLNNSVANLSGNFQLISDIPLGVGMGASAALCVAVARWFAAQHLLADHNIYAFAKKLEHLFHGNSSGLDVAGVAASAGIYFQRDTVTPLQQNWRPHWFLSFCGQTGITINGIEKVRKLQARDNLRAQQIDEQMQASVLQAQLSLASTKDEALFSLSQAIQIAYDCFAQWGLITPQLDHHMQLLLEAGALAVKPTGSGNGGYVLSLWEKHTLPSSKAMQLLTV